MILSVAEAAIVLGVEADDATLNFLLPLTQRECEQFCGWELEQASYTRYYPKTERGGSPHPFVRDFASLNNANTSRVIALDHKWVPPTGLRVWEKDGSYAEQAEVMTDDDELTVGTDFVLDLDESGFARSGHLIRLGSSWPYRRHSVKVLYTGGFTADEFDAKAGEYDASSIKLAIMNAITVTYGQAKIHEKSDANGSVGPIISENIQGYSYVRGMTLVDKLYGMKTLLPGNTMRALQKYKRYGLPT